MMAQALSPVVERLDTVIALLEALGHTLALLPVTASPQRHDAGTSQRPVTPQGPQAVPQPSPQVLGTYDPHGAVVRIQALRAKGRAMTASPPCCSQKGFPRAPDTPGRGVPCAICLGAMGSRPREGLLRRVGRGRYVITPPQQDA